MRFLFKIISRLFALLTLIFALLYAYGAYIANEAKEKEAAFDVEITSGNGFGGEAGFKIIDSDYVSSKFFWIDSNLLLFKTRRRTDANGHNRDHHIWDLSSGEVLPLQINGIANCISNGHLYYRKRMNPDVPKGERALFDTYESKLVRQSDRWTVEGSRNLRSVWPKTPERYELTWRPSHECRSWYFLPTENRLPSDVPKHSFDYLSQWNWIHRSPTRKYLDSGAAHPEMGFFEIGKEPYYGQRGIRIREPVNIPVKQHEYLVFRYISFLNKYWIAISIFGDPNKTKFMGLLDRNGDIQRLEWPPDWKLYEGIPLPTRKGIFWSSHDYRDYKPGFNQSGGFIRTHNNMIHKVLHGAAEGTELSPDGCKLAFFNRPKDTDTSSSRLRIFDVCNSSIQGREMIDVNYRDRSG